MPAPVTTTAQEPIGLQKWSKSLTKQLPKQRNTDDKITRK